MDEYAVVINGIKHTQQLSPDDAKRVGLTDKDKVKPVKSKAATPENKAGTPATPDPAATPAK